MAQAKTATPKRKGAEKKIETRNDRRDKVQTFEAVTFDTSTFDIKAWKSDQKWTKLRYSLREYVQGMVTVGLAVAVVFLVILVLLFAGA